MDFRQKQYEQFNDLQKLQFHLFVASSNFIHFTFQLLLDEYDDLSIQQKRIIISFLWDCHFSMLSPLYQSIYRYYDLKTEKSGREASCVCDHDWEVWDKIQQLYHHQSDFKYNIDERHKYHNSLQQEFNLLCENYLTQDIYTWTKTNTLYFKLKQKIKKFIRRKNK